jgi:hypothetical protein
MFKGDRMEEVGTIPTWQVIGRLQTATQFAGPYTPSNFVVEDIVRTASSTWTWAKHNFSATVQEINALNGDGAQLVNLQKARKGAMDIRFAEDIEASMWGAPTSADDGDSAKGFPFLLPKVTSAQAATIRAGTSANGFIAANPVYSGGVDAADWCGINRSTDANAAFRSYAGLWSNANGEWTDDDVKNLSICLHKMSFKTPANANINKLGELDLVLYTNVAMIANAEAKARKNNDTTDPIGGSQYDLARGYGTTLFRGFPLEYVPTLDADTSNPLYPVNHTWVKLLALKGDFFRNSTPAPSPTLHDVVRTITQLTYCPAITDPQKGGACFAYVA